MMSDWIEVGHVDDVPLRGSRVIATEQGNIAIFKAAGGRIFALWDKCPHKGGPLSQGIVHGASVTCPLHNWVISLESGAAQGADAGSVRTFPLKIDEGRLLLNVAALAVKSAAA